jgi:hypothetical protein
MLQLYVQYVQGTTADLQEVRLICKEQMVSFFVNFFCEFRTQMFAIAAGDADKRRP